MIAALDPVGPARPEAKLARCVAGRAVAARAGEGAGERAIVETPHGAERA